VTKTEKRLREELAELLERQKEWVSSYRLMDRRAARINRVREMLAKIEAKR